MEQINSTIRAICQELYSVGVDPELTRPDEQFGDYATNIALRLAKEIGKNPREIAEELAAKLQGTGEYKKVEVAGPGFINIELQDQQLLANVKQASELKRSLEGQEILVEFGDPNPFKEMHIGHLYSYIVGDAICNLLEAAGATVRRLSYHGDVGLHVAKAIWGLQKEGVDPASIGDNLKQNIGYYYAKGATAYLDDAAAKQEMDEINRQVYEKNNTAINAIYHWGKEKSFAYFDNVLADFGTKTDKRYFESESSEAGLKFVKNHIGTVFKKSDGAVVYEGEKVGLHTRVFITSEGLPTYEAKDLGLIELKKQDFPEAQQSIIITAHEQIEYFKVMLAALAEFDSKAAKMTKHLAHGFVSLSTGKMSSRTGDVYSAISVLVDMQETVKQSFPEATVDTEKAAIKYGLLKNRLGSDIVYDAAESFSIEGNSGPYLQYAHARAKSILNKSSAINRQSTAGDFTDGERSLAGKISEYPEVVAKATGELAPHQICTYLYELAQNFNRFYEHNRVIGDDRQTIRLMLIQKYADVLKNGLGLLGIAAPDKM